MCGEPSAWCSYVPQYVFIAFNLVFWVGGAALFGTGIWMRVDPFLSDLFVRLSDIRGVSLEYLYIASYAFMMVGAFIFLVGLCGCCGATKHNVQLLAIYLLLMVLLVVVELSAGIYLAVSLTRVMNNFRSSLKGAVMSYSGRRNESINLIQIKFSCCGVENVTDYVTGTWYRSAKKQGLRVPESCCRHDDITTMFPRPVDTVACMAEATNRSIPPNQLFRTGCYLGTMNWLKGSSKRLIGAGIGIACIEMLSIIFGVCVCRQVSSFI